MNKTDAQIYIGLAGLALTAYIFWSGKETVKAVGNAVNPLNNNNVINQGANALFGLDNKTASIGTKIYDAFHPAEPAKIAQPMKTKTASEPPKGYVRKSSNPRSRDYYVYVKA